MLLSQSQSWKQRFGRSSFLCISSSDKCIYKASHQTFLSFSITTLWYSLILQCSPLKFPAAYFPACWDSPEVLACNEYRNWIGFRYDNHLCRLAPGCTARCVLCYSRDIKVHINSGLPSCKKEGNYVLVRKLMCVVTITTNTTIIASAARQEQQTRSEKREHSTRQIKTLWLKLRWGFNTCFWEHHGLFCLQGSRHSGVSLMLLT